MIVDKIETYLKTKDKTVNEFLLFNATQRFQEVLKRQFMEDREERTGVVYPSQLGKCARQTAYKYHGFESEPMQTRAFVNFFFGDIAEIAMLTLAELAGCKLSMKNELVEIPIDKLLYRGRPDAVLTLDSGEKVVVECKKMSPYAFDLACRKGVDNAWGYVTQLQLYLHALEIDKGLFFIFKETGHLHEVEIQRDESYFKEATRRAISVENSTKEDLPPREFKPEKEIYRRQETGKLKLGMQCSYCPFTSECWPQAKLEFKSGKPVYYVEE